MTSPGKGGDIALSSEDAWFELDAGTLTKIKSAATALGHNEVNVTLHNGIIRLTVTDNEDSTSHEFDIDMNGYSECEDMKEQSSTSQTYGYLKVGTIVCPFRRSLFHIL